MRGNNEKANLSCGLFQQEVFVSKVKYDGWCAKWMSERRIVPRIYFTKEELIRAWNLGGEAPRRWENYRRKGQVKAVKVRIVEVDE